MRNFKILFVIMIINTSSLICSSKVYINGVSYICQTPEGRLGRCTSRDICHNHESKNRTASILQCPEGHGSRPFVCCIFGNNIVFPDEDEISGDEVEVKQLPSARNAVEKPKNSAILHSNDNGNYNRDSRNESVQLPSARNAVEKPKNSAILHSNDNGNYNRDSRNESVQLPSARNAVEKPKNSAIFFSDDDGNYDRHSRNESVPSTTRLRAATRAPIMALFPKPPFCGPTSVQHKIYNGKEADLGEFPWLVNLEYTQDNSTTVIACAGSIINHRYILTAAHCVKGDIEQVFGKLVSIRAGDHNTRTDIDCDEEGCIEPFKRFKIISIIVHENYTVGRRGRAFNDIALLKTNRKIPYSLAVAPVCLPDTIDPMPSLRSITQFTVAGWGAMNVNVSQTDEKRIVNLPYVPNEYCKLRVNPEQICAGGIDGKDSCSGDSGGSLCRIGGTSWFVEGIVSYGRRDGCGADKPSIYTRIRSFLPWIHENVVEN